MSSERLLCTICDGVLRRNGNPVTVDGKVRQFWRCTSCRQGGWKNGEDHHREHGHGPVFEGLHGEMANQITRNYAEEGRA